MFHRTVNAPLVDAIWQTKDSGLKLKTFHSGSYLAVHDTDFVCYKKHTGACPEVDALWRCKVDGIFIDSDKTDFSIECDRRQDQRTLVNRKKCCTEIYYAVDGSQTGSLLKLHNQWLDLNDQTSLQAVEGAFERSYWHLNMQASVALKFK